MSKSSKHINQRAILLSFVVSFLLTIVKFLAYYQTTSYAILTDAVESIVNVIASGFALYSISLTKQPKDHNHPYGHGKIEFFSAGFEGALIMIAGLATLIPAIISFIKPHEVSSLGNGIALLAITILVNGGLGWYLQQLGKKNNSITLVADGKHLMSDSISSAFLIAGLFIVKLTDIQIIDSFLSLILSVFLMKNGYELVRKSIGGLMDETDYQIIEEITITLNKERKKKWIDVHNLRAQRYGADLHIDCHLTLPYYISLQESHDEVIAFENTLKASTRNEVEIFIHTDPCLPQCCHYCMVDDCPVRQHVFDGKIEWTPAKLGLNAKHFHTEA
ncbi:cation diffusion facilitator family transporter [Emticicia sp. 17c]|uniref:cation diffusion facilitator family transporter n=1 Tax=Emticicia sp. 17c TaxID=3127704 RepID=UPI00301E054E